MLKIKQKIIILCGITLTIVVGTFSSIVLLNVSKNTSLREENLIAANAKIIGVTKITITAPTMKRIVKYKMVPSWSDLNPPTQSGFSFTFTSATAVNDMGQSKVTYIVDVDPKVAGTTSKEIIFMIDGFQTKVIANANTKIQNVAIGTVIVPTIKTRVNYGVVPKLDDLTPPTQSGFSFTFTSATAVNDMGQSKVTYIVDVDPKVAGTTSKEIIFIVEDFNFDSPSSVFEGLQIFIDMGNG